MIGIYIHFPFCSRKCSYCSFYSVDYSSERSAEYFNSLHSELVRRSTKVGDVADTVYFGGGTPSLILPDTLKSTITCIKDNYDISENCEITIEANPESLTEENLHAYISAGVNRISLGIQSLDVQTRKSIGRNCLLPREDLLKTIEIISKTKINYSVDVIAGVQGQTAGDMEKEIDAIYQYRPDHFSVYILSVEAGTPLYDRFIPNESFNGQQRDIFSAVMNKLKSLGYEQYEVSNYAVNGKYSRHNMKYWRYDDYLGFGPGAHSFYGGVRSCNDENLQRYCAGEIDVRIDERNLNQSIAEYLMTGLRLIKGVSEAHFKGKFQCVFPESVITRGRELERSGLLVLSHDNQGMHIRISDDGIFFLDDVIYKLTEALL